MGLSFEEPWGALRSLGKPWGALGRLEGFQEVGKLESDLFELEEEPRTITPWRAFGSVGSLEDAFWSPWEPWGSLGEPWGALVRLCEGSRGAFGWRRRKPVTRKLRV